MLVGWSQISENEPIKNKQMLDLFILTKTSKSSKCLILTRKRLIFCIIQNDLSSFFTKHKLGYKIIFPHTPILK